jgi:hypothetical protein
MLEEKLKMLDLETKEKRVSEEREFEIKWFQVQLTLNEQILDSGRENGAT